MLTTPLMRVLLELEPRSELAPPYKSPRSARYNSKFKLHLATNLMGSFLVNLSLIVTEVMLK